MDFSGNSTGNHTASWHPEPTTRGSFTILSSCIITLTLCVWKAVHLNIPEHESCLLEQKKTDIRYWITRWVTLQTGRKVGWLILGILAPEMVAFIAWAQRREAQELNDVMVEKLSRILPSPSSNNDIELGQLNQTQPPTDDSTEMNNSIQRAMAYFEHNPWTITHSFYAVMGGYAIDTSVLPEGQKFLPGRRDRLTLKPEGLKFLAEERPDLIPRVSKADIRDKSKADTFAKLIATVQAFFFIIQCLYRLIQHLPISLLELNTFGHTLCALLSYAFWWEKPFEVAEPSLISVDESQDLWAALCFYSRLHRGHIRDSDFLSPVASEGQEMGQLENTDGELHLRPEEILGNLKCTEPPERFGRKDQGQNYWVYTPRDRLRWSLVGSCVRVTNSVARIHTKSATLQFRGSPLADRISNWPSGLVDYVMDSMTRDQKVLVAFTLAGLSYGALHLLAWNHHFASHAEHLLWQISGSTVATSGPAFLFFCLFLFHFLFRLSRADGFFVSVAIVLLYVCVSGAYGLLYIFSRVYLVVESFISFVYLPDAAFQQPQWTYYFPHIT